MRPTINISEWKLAVNLTQTRRIQNYEAMPATHCECRFCQNWRLVYKDVLPEDLIHQLYRLGISPTHPVDDYGREPLNGEVDYRIWFYVVGTILSGPSGWLQHHTLGDLRNYVSLQESPYFVSMIIQPQKQFYDVMPNLGKDSTQDIIQIDLRLQIPWRIE